MLREVERAVNRKLPIIVYQHEETQLSKSLEYFLASTQWFIPDERNGMEELIGIVKRLKEQKRAKKINTVHAVESGDKRKKCIFGLTAIAVICMISCACIFFSGSKTEVSTGDVFSYGRLDLTGALEENLDWMVLDVNEEDQTVLCIAKNVVAFFPYDGAESGKRGSFGDVYYSESEKKHYTDEQVERLYWGAERGYYCFERYGIF